MTQAERSPLAQSQSPKSLWRKACEPSETALWDDAATIVQ